MTFKIDLGVTYLVTDPERSYIFDKDTYNIYPEYSDDAETVSSPVKFPHLTGLDIMRAYVEHIADKNITAAFAGIDDMDYSRLFWNYFDDGAEKFVDFEKFSHTYPIDVISGWCDENGIAHYTYKRDFLFWLGDAL